MPSLAGHTYQFSRRLSLHLAHDLPALNLDSDLAGSKLKRDFLIHLSGNIANCSCAIDQSKSPLKLGSKTSDRTGVSTEVSFQLITVTWDQTVHEQKHSGPDSQPGSEMKLPRTTYELTFGGKFLNIFATSLSSCLVFFSGFPDRAPLDAPLQINCLELPSNMLTIRVPTL
jgi:hypothetical protein